MGLDSPPTASALYYFALRRIPYTPYKLREIDAVRQWIARRDSRAGDEGFRVLLLTQEKKVRPTSTGERDCQLMI